MKPVDIVACLFLFGLVWHLLPLHDDTDQGAGHSGFILRTDALTGCQYLGTIWGAITPRLDATGKPMCGKP